MIDFNFTVLIEETPWNKNYIWHRECMYSDSRGGSTSSQTLLWPEEGRYEAKSKMIAYIYEVYNI